MSTPVKQEKKSTQENDCCERCNAALKASHTKQESELIKKGKRMKKKRLVLDAAHAFLSHPRKAGKIRS
jgi:methionyl-tRNA synthetase